MMHRKVAKASLPTLLATVDCIPGALPINGRRVAAQHLLRLWAQYSLEDSLHLLLAQDNLSEPINLQVKKDGYSGKIQYSHITSPAKLFSSPALFVPDIEIAKWAGWRQQVGRASFSIIGQIHTIATNRALTAIERLVDQPLTEWDALICSSSAGKKVVESIVESRKEFLREHLGATRFPSIHLPVIPLPMPREVYKAKMDQAKARKKLGISQEARVLIWIGRLSLLTKSDPWPCYQLLEQCAINLDQPLVLIECGADDTEDHRNDFSLLRSKCPSVTFVRLGSFKNPASEIDKELALAAADVAVSLVDNIQETFGLSVAEAMSSRLPVIASDWSGYRDLIRHQIDGYLIPTSWGESSEFISQPLGWLHELGVITYPEMAGALAQVVNVNWRLALMEIIEILRNENVLRAMGESAFQRSLTYFHEDVVLRSYMNLFDELSSRRSTWLSGATNDKPASPCANLAPMRLDPAKAFMAFSSSHRLHQEPSDINVRPIQNLSSAHRYIWQSLAKVAPAEIHSLIIQDIKAKHQ